MMAESTLQYPDQAPKAVARPQALETILLGGIAVAVLDASNAITFWALYKGTQPHVIFQSIAAGVLGRDAFSGGMAAAWLGALLHFLIACGIAAAYYLASLAKPVLHERPVPCGMMYGAVVYLVMNHVVVPLSRANSPAFIPGWFVANLVGHIVLVGLPVALIAHRSATRRR